MIEVTEPVSAVDEELENELVRRPTGLPENVPEPRCSDIVQFRHLDNPGIFQVSVTNRYKGSHPNSYGFSEIGGNRTFQLDEHDLVRLWATEKSALWPVVYAKADLMHRRRDIENGGLTWHGEVLAAAKDRGAGR